MNSEAAWLGSSCMSVSGVAVRMSAGSVVVQSVVGTEDPFQDAHPQLIPAGTFSSSPSGPKMSDSREGSKEEATVTFMTHYRKSHTTTSTVFCSFSARHWDHLCWMGQSILGFTFWGEACQSTCGLSANLHRCWGRVTSHMAGAASAGGSRWPLCAVATCGGWPGGMSELLTLSWRRPCGLDAAAVEGMEDRLCAHHREAWFSETSQTENTARKPHCGSER